MARRTALPHWRVLPEHGTPHLGMTARAQLAHRRAGLERLDVGDRAVRVVAGGARHLAFADRHVRYRPLGLGDLLTVAGDAQLGLRCLHELMRGRLGTVDAVTGGAGEIAPVVRAPVPPGVLAAIVAGQARLAALGG